MKCKDCEYKGQSCDGDDYCNAFDSSISRSLANGCWKYEKKES